MDVFCKYTYLLFFDGDFCLFFGDLRCLFTGDLLRFFIGDLRFILLILPPFIIET